jgi:hypothetical protein
MMIPKLPGTFSVLIASLSNNSLKVAAASQFVTNISHTTIAMPTEDSVCGVYLSNVNHVIVLVLVLALAPSLSLALALALALAQSLALALALALAMVLVLTWQMKLSYIRNDLFIN